jgi:hypothetical protein
MNLHEKKKHLDILLARARAGDLEARATLWRILGPSVRQVVRAALRPETTPSLQTQSVRDVADAVRSRGITQPDRLVGEVAGAVWGRTFPPAVAAAVSHACLDTVVDYGDE